MSKLQDYYSGRVERVALKHNVKVYERANYANCGWWIFKNDDEKTVAKIYYNFQGGYCTFSDGAGNIYKGVTCEYGNDEHEVKLFQYVENKILRKV